MIKSKFLGHKPVSSDIVSFFFEPDKPMRFVPGQYIEIVLNHEPKDTRGHKRWFTISSSPLEESLSITTRINDESSTFKKKLKSLKPSDELLISPPMGDFVLPKDPSIPLVFVAAGIGVTPYRSMLKYLQDSGEKRNIIMIYGVSRTEELCFVDLIKNNSTFFHPIVGKRLSGGDILDIAGPYADSAIYLSGPEKMVEKIDKELKAKGISQTQLRTDFFHNY